MKKIPLTQGQFAIVDAEDYSSLINYKWRVAKRGRTAYAVRHLKRNEGVSYMHREIMNPPVEKEVDHIDGNGLNNTKNNLRIVTHRENCQNKHFQMTSNYPGVKRETHSPKWKSNIHVKGKVIHLGMFDTEEEAYMAYQWACEQVEKGKKIPPHINPTKTSKYRGVSFNKRNNRWYSEISVNKVVHYLGCFKSEEEAFMAYNNARVKYGRERL